MPNEDTKNAEIIAVPVERVANSKDLVAIGHGIGWCVATLAVACIYVAFCP